MMAEQPNNVVTLPGKQRASGKRGDEKLADDIRKLYRKLCNAIDLATQANLHVEVFLDSKDTYSGNRVRGREVIVTKKL
jgi:hypothetical protein